MRKVRHSALLLAAALTVASGAAGATTKYPARAPIYHPGPAVVRDFARTALAHLKGPAQRPFLKLLSTLPPPAKQPGVTISIKATKNMSCSGGVCTPTAAVAVLNVGQLTDMLSSQSITVGTSAQAPDIFVKAPFSWTSPNGLTLQAIGNIDVEKAVSDAGPAPLTLTYNANGAGGALSFGDKGHISFLSTGNPLTINGQSYILANNIQLLAQLIARNPSGNFALSASYNAAHDGTYTHAPIPTALQGNLQGLGNTISNLHVQSSGNGVTGGLFQQTAGTATVAYLHLNHLQLLSEGDSKVGGFAGQNDGALVGVTVDNATTVSASFSVDGECYAGGLVGLNTGGIGFSHSLANVQIDYQSANFCAIGGLVGYTKGDVDHSFAGQGSVFVSGPGSQYNVGGLIGVAGTDVFLTPNVTWSFATGAVTVTNMTAGSAAGFVGENLGQFCCGSAFIANSSASGPVNGGGESGGFVGIDTAVIDVSVATGAVSSAGCNHCGGFAAEIIGGGVYTTSISDSQSFGSISGPGLVGGFVGADVTPQDIFNSGWCTTSSGFTDPHHGAGTPADDAGITPFSC